MSHGAWQIAEQSGTRPCGGKNLCTVRSAVTVDYEDPDHSSKDISRLHILRPAGHSAKTGKALSPCGEITWKYTNSAGTEITMTQDGEDPLSQDYKYPIETS